MSLTQIVIIGVASLVIASNAQRICAQENGKCACDGRVRYGSRSVNSAAGGTWTDWQDVTGRISCSEPQPFKDSVPGTRGECQCAPKPTTSGPSKAPNTSGPSKAPTTLNPTAAPTKAPTDWYQHPTHKLNVSKIEDRLNALAATNAKLVTKVAQQTAQINALNALQAATKKNFLDVNTRLNATILNMVQTINTRLDQVQLQADNLALESQSIINDVTQVNTSIRTALASVSQDVAAANTASSQLRAALIAATTNPDDSSYNCQDVDSCIPRIEAEASRLMFNVRGGKAVLNTDKCNSVDLCSVAKQSQDIFQALQNL